MGATDRRQGEVSSDAAAGGFDIFGQANKRKGNHGGCRNQEIEL
jgi:hypothetical protein